MIEPGEIYFVNAKDRRSTGCEIWPDRPAVVVSSRAAIACSGTVDVVYLTSSRNPKPFSVRISEESFTDAVKKYPDHVALCGQVHAVDKGRLGNYLGRVSPAELSEIKAVFGMVHFDGGGAQRRRPRRREPKSEK